MDARPKINALANQVCTVENSQRAGWPIWVSSLAVVIISPQVLLPSKS